MKGLIPWIIFGLSALTCLIWISTGVRDDLREDSVFHDIIKARAEQARSGTDLHIGVAGDWGRHKSVLEGIQAGADKLNSQGGMLGRPVVLDVQDDKGTVEGALTVAQSFASNPMITMVIGHTDPRLNGAVTQNYEFYRLLNISPNASSAGNGNGTHPLQFSNSLAPKQLGNSLLDLAQKQGWTRIGLIHSNTAFHQRQARLMESMADARLIQVPLAMGYQGQELTQDITRWQRELGLDALVLTVDKSQFLRLIHHIRSANMDLPIVTTTDKPENMAEDDPSVGELYFLQSSPADAALANHNTSPVSPFALGYETIMLLERAATASGSLLADDLAAALKRLHLDPPVVTTTSIDSNGNAVKLTPVFSRW